LLINRAGLGKILSGNVGILKQGFWWEFLARAVAANLCIVETPVRHRVRARGVTQVYRPTKVPRIAIEHLIGLYRLRQELDALHQIGISPVVRRTPHHLLRVLDDQSKGGEDVGSSPFATPVNGLQGQVQRKLPARRGRFEHFGKSSRN
jgi:hypothetical protein